MYTQLYTDGKWRARYEKKTVKASEATTKLTQHTHTRIQTDAKRRVAMKNYRRRNFFRTLNSRSICIRTIRTRTGRPTLLTVLSTDVFTRESRKK